MKYNVRYRKQALQYLAYLALHEKRAYVKAEKLIAELTEHPYSGTGKPEPLVGERKGQWSRRITQKTSISI